MRPLPILLLVAALMLAGCDSNAPTDEPPTGEPPTDEPPTDGTLVVSTSTLGEDPDQDGYMLRVDDTNSLDLEPEGTVEIDLPPGRHSLQLLGVAGHCAVTPATSLDVNVASDSTTPVTFEVTCPLTGARITASTTGQDLDPDGYQVVVDGTDRGAIPANGTVLTRLESGTHTIGLTGLALNCAVDGSSLRTVTIVETEAVAVNFAVDCTQGGVIEVVLSGALGLGFDGVVDGVSRFPIGHSPFFGSSGRLTGVPAGTHVVSLSVPPDCSNEPGSRPVTMPPGGTVEVKFVVTCVSGLRITTQTTGPEVRYGIYLCTDYYCDSWPNYVGQVEPNGTLVFKPESDTYWVVLNVPRRNCRVHSQNPHGPIRYSEGTSVDVTFQITCS